jgi:D-alanyl-D-alanine carboxypeptidase
MRQPTVAWDPAWERFAGLYRGKGGDSQIVLLNKPLVLINPNGNNVDNPTTLEPLGGRRFRYVAPTGGGVVGEVVQFVEQPGKPMRMYTGDSWIDKVAPWRAVVVLSERSDRRTCI